MKEPSGGFAKGSPVLQLFDWKSGKQLHELVPGDTQDGFIYDVWFHPDGFIVGTASAFPGKGKLFFWKPGEEKPFYTGSKLTNGRSIAIHPDGHRLRLHNVGLQKRQRPPAQRRRVCRPVLQRFTFSLCQK